jgi:hypothetical protein
MTARGVGVVTPAEGARSAGLNGAVTAGAAETEWNAGARALEGVDET